MGWLANGPASIGGCFRHCVGVRACRRGPDWSDMDYKVTDIGDTELVEYVEECSDGSYCQLMGWPSQTRLTTTTTTTSGRSLESWFPDTKPTLPDTNLDALGPGLVWRPYRIVRKTSESQGHGHGPPLHTRGALKFHRTLGWHYRYFTPFRIRGKPPFPASLITKPLPPTPAEPASTLQANEKARLRRLRRLLKKLILEKQTKAVGMPTLCLRRIEQQPGFLGLKPMLRFGR